MHFDQLFENIGEFGFYQKTRHMVFVLLGITASWQVMAITFLGAYVDYHCYMEELTNFTFEEQKRFMFKNEPSCEIYNMNYSEARYDFTKFNASDEFYASLNKTKCDTQWVYDKRVFSSTLGSKFQLCSRDIEYWAQSILNFGIFCGNFLVGYMSDRFGRKKSLIGFQIIWIMSAIFGALTNNIIMWVISRFIIGACICACFDAAYVLAIETSAKKGRFWVNILFQVYFAIGVTLLALLAYMVPDFTILQLIMGVCPVIPLIMYFVFLDESPRWLASQGRLEEALDIMKNISAVNKQSFPDNLDLLLNQTTNNKVMTIFDLFKTSNMRKTTIAMWLAWFSVTMGYYGMMFAVENLSGNIFLNLAISGLTEFPAYLVITLIKKRSRRCITVISYTTVALLCFLFGILGLSGYRESISQMIIIMVAKLFSCIVFFMLYLNAVEVFPTTLRTIGLGSSSSMARIGGILQPQLQKLQQELPFIQYIAYGVVTLLGSTGSYFIPETLDKELPETVEDIEMIE